MTAASMPPAERSKLVAILGRLGSDHAGEQAAAANAASRLLKRFGLAWDQVVVPAEGERPPPPPPASGWRADMALCRQHLAHCSEWEQTFIRNLSQRRAGPTPGQATKLRQIASELRDRGCR